MRRTLLQIAFLQSKASPSTKWFTGFLHILSNARPKNNVNKVPRWVFRYVGNKTFDFSSKKKDFLPKNDQIWPKTGIFGQFGPGLFSALLVGRLVVVARGRYLARHLFTLYLLPQNKKKQRDKKYYVTNCLLGHAACPTKFESFDIWTKKRRRGFIWSKDIIVTHSDVVNLFLGE